MPFSTFVVLSSALSQLRGDNKNKAEVTASLRCSNWFSVLPPDKSDELDTKTCSESKAASGMVALYNDREHGIEV